MKTVENFKLFGLSILLTASLAACDQPGPAENAGRKLDNASNQVGLKIGETVVNVEEKLKERNTKVGVALDDAEITTKVKSAIFSEPGLKTLRISVDTKNRVVTLTGSVDSQYGFDRAKSLAEAVDGIKEVQNHLQVTYPR
jgi:osmotically-inducible protein OsmY